MLRRTFDVAARVSPKFRRLMMKRWYETLVVLDRERDITFMNYGYSGLDNSTSGISINDSAQANRYCIHLYHHVAAAIDFSGKDGVEVVINLESSDCYGSMTKFVSEVYRVLRPDGHFLFSDHRDRDKLDLLREQLNDSGLRVVKETDITLNVVAALDLDNDRKQRMIAQKCPRVLRREAEEFAAMKGSRAYETFKSGSSR